MNAEERARVKALQRERKLRVLDHLSRHGESSLAALADAADATEQETRAIVMRLIRSDVVRNTRHRGGKETRYELWSQTIARLKAKERPAREYEPEVAVASGWTVA